MHVGAGIDFRMEVLLHELDHLLLGDRIDDVVVFGRSDNRFILGNLSADVTEPEAVGLDVLGAGADHLFLHQCHRLTVGTFLLEVIEDLQAGVGQFVGLHGVATQQNQQGHLSTREFGGAHTHHRGIDVAHLLTHDAHELDVQRLADHV